MLKLKKAKRLGVHPSLFEEKMKKEKEKENKFD